MTDQELKDLVASLAEKHADLARLHQETGAQLQETWAQLQETERFRRASAEDAERRQREREREQQETARQIRELGKQIGGLGDKFGSFTEGMALPSMTKILAQRFNMDVIAPRVLARNNGHSLELNVLAYSHDPKGDAYVVEVKSHLREEALDQIKKILRQLRDFLPEHRDRKLHGILAAVNVSADLRDKVLAEGIYLARIHDGQFELQVPDAFQARAF